MRLSAAVGAARDWLYPSNADICDFRRFDEDLKRMRYLPVGAFLFGFAVYAPLALQRSAWGDDFPLLNNPRHVIDISVDDGRPVLALVNWLILGSVETIGGLVFPRILGVVGIAFFLAYLTRLLQGLGWSPMSALLVACSSGLLPPFHEYVGWATVFSHPWVMLLGAWTGLTWVDAIRSRRWPGALLSFFGFLVALLTYPPAAMFCWAALGIRLVSQSSPARRSVANLCTMGFLVATAGTASLVVGRIAMIVLNVEPAARFQIVDSFSELGQKLLWFSTHPPAVAARLFLIGSPSGLATLLTAGPVLLVIVGGLFLRYEGSPSRRLVSLVVLALPVALTMSVHLISTDNQIEYRFMGGIIVLVWVYLLTAVRGAWEGLASQKPQLFQYRCVGNVALLVVVGGGVAMAITNINQVFIEPSRIKERYLVEQLSDFDYERHLRIVVIEPSDGWPSRDNLGIYSARTDLAQPWVLEPNIRQLLVEHHGPHRRSPVAIVRAPIEPKVDDFELDLRPLKRLL